MITTKRLRNCKAEAIIHQDNNRSGAGYFIALDNNEKKYVENYRALRSYQSLVAIYDVYEGILYLLPRWNYSRTTAGHMRRFVEDYLPYVFYDNWSVNNVRKGVIERVVIAEGYSMTQDGEIWRY